MSFDFTGFVHNEDLPEFFLIHKYMDDEGNIHPTTVVAANHRVSSYTLSRGREVPMVYPWAKNNDDDISEWIWTETPYVAPNIEDRATKEIMGRMQLMGYQPVVHTNDSPDSPRFHTYAKINQHASLDRGCKYLEYIPNGETHLWPGQDPLVMTVDGVYELEAKAAGRDIPEDVLRKEYIIGLGQLHGRINDSENPITKDAVLILTHYDTAISSRSHVIQNAIDMGFNSRELAVLIDLMADGRVVFDNERRAYKVPEKADDRHGYAYYAGQKLLSANEFYAFMGYTVEPAVAMSFVTDIYHACRLARDNIAFNHSKDPMDRVLDNNLIRIH